MRRNTQKTPSKYTLNSRQIDRIYNGSYEEYEDSADYIDIRTVLKGRVVA